MPKNKKLKQIATDLEQLDDDMDGIIERLHELRAEILKLRDMLEELADEE